MATTTYLYHMLGVRGYKLLRSELIRGGIRLHVKLKAEKRRCRSCGAGRGQVSLDGTFERSFLAPPVGSKRQEIVLHGHIQRCRRCGARLREAVHFSDGRARYTRSFKCYVVELCQIATLQSVAQHLRIGWDTVKDIFKGHLRTRLRQRRLGKVRRIAIDELAVGKRVGYLTLVLDLDTHRVLWSGEGRSADSLRPFLLRLKRARAPLQAVAMDMWPAYYAAVRDVFPHLTIVHDRFHIMQLVNKALDRAQRDLAGQIPKALRSRAGRLRFVLLRAQETLDEDGLDLLNRLMEINQPLARAHLLKEELRQLWQLDTIDTAAVFLDRWIDQTRSLGLHAFKQLANTISKHREAILAWHHCRISTGPLEGINNKAKVLKRQAYGYRDMEYFKLRLAFIGSETPRFPG